MKNPVRLGPGRHGIDLSRTGAKFLYQSGNDPRKLLFWERVPIILLTVVLGAALYFWAARLYGRAGALLSLALFCMSPNILAHGTLFTTDLGITAFYFIAASFLYYFFTDSKISSAVGSGFAAGLAILSKISGLVLLPAAALLFLIAHFRKRNRTAEEKPFPWRLFIILASTLLIFSIGNKVVFPVLGPLCLTALSFPRFENARARAAQKLLLLGGWVLCFIFAIRLFKKYEPLLALAITGWIAGLMVLSWAVVTAAKKAGWSRLLQVFLLIWLTAAVTVILGYTDFLVTLIRYKPFDHFLRTFNIALNHARSFHIHCVEGSFVTCDWKYFPSLMFIKTPLVTLALSCAGLFVLLKGKYSLMQKACVLGPPLVYFIVAVFFNRINIGLRHILPVYPFLFLIAGGAAPIIGRFSKGWRLGLSFAVVALLFFSFARVARISPDYLSYFNEWTGTAEEGARLVGDSNIDWGQNNLSLALWAREKKVSLKIYLPMQNADLYEYYGMAWEAVRPEDLENPEPGYYALSIESLSKLKHEIREFWKKRNPVYRAGNTLRIYHI